jgi:hypothetical protein
LTVLVDGPTTKELLEHRKEKRQKHRAGFKEFLKAQRAAVRNSSFIIVFSFLLLGGL